MKFIRTTSYSIIDTINQNVSLFTTKILCLGIMNGIQALISWSLVDGSVEKQEVYAKYRIEKWLNSLAPGKQAKKNHRK